MATLNLNLDTSELAAINSWVLLLTEKNLRFTVAKALTESAKAAQKDLRQATPRYVTSPTRWTLDGTYVRFAKPSDLTAEVGFKSDAQGRGNPAGRYLRPIVKGTTPQLKAADLAATKIAREAPGAVLIPARTSGLVNSAGNVPLSKYATILSGARQGGSQYFIGPVKRGSSVKAVFERKEGFIGRTSTLERTTKRLFTIDPNPKARQERFPVSQLLQQGFEQAWPVQLQAAFQAELARKLGG